jgi:hypothetical protein
LTRPVAPASIRNVWPIGAGLVVLWLLAIAGIRVAREPRNPPSGPPSDPVRDEAPALVNLLVNNFGVTRHAVPATVLDLAARGVVTIEHVGPEHDVIRVGHGAPPGLTPYESGVLGVLHSRATGGVVPVGALGTGPQEHARGWWRSFRGTVIREAQARGLSRDLWDGPTLTVITALGLLPAPFLALAAGDFRLGIFAAIAASATVAGLKATQRQRETSEGLAAASAWLGVRRVLEASTSIEDVPPGGVVVWERRLAYAAAMGLARAALTAMPMGADDERRAWSSFGGVWRPVRIRYPQWWPPAWGWSPWAAVLVGLLIALLGSLALRLALRIGWPEDDPMFPSIVAALRVFVIFVGTAGSVLTVWGMWALVRGILDLGTPRRITGQVLRVRKRGDEQPRHYVAIDDGSSDVVRALRVTSGELNTAGLTEYRDATAEVTPRLRHVRSIGPA